MINISELKRLGVIIHPGDKFNGDTIIEFAWRENTCADAGRHPRSDAVVKAELRDGTVVTGAADTLEWCEKGTLKDVVRWKPHILNHLTP